MKRFFIYYISVILGLLAFTSQADAFWADVDFRPAEAVSLDTKNNDSYRLMGDLITAGVDVGKGRVGEGLMAFQRREGLSVTATVDMATASRLDSVLSEVKRIDLRDVQRINSDLPDLKILDGKTYKRTNNTENEPTTHYEALSYRILNMLPETHANGLKRLTVFYASGGSKGLGGGGTILIRGQGVSDEDFTGVLVHEMGHVVDTGVIRGASGPVSSFTDGRKSVLMNDKSVKYYNISWRDNMTQRVGMSRLDFVSGYAMSDPFEDFAETYAFYVLQGNNFRKLIKDNKTLAAKYGYMKDEVFKGREFFSGEETLTSAERVWDVTAMKNEGKVLASTVRVKGSLVKSVKENVKVKKNVKTEEIIKRGRLALLPNRDARVARKEIEIGSKIDRMGSISNRMLLFTRK